MQKKQKFTTAALAALAAAGGMAVTGVAQAQTTPTIQPMSGAPEIRDGEQRFKVRGRLQFDVLSNEWEASDPANAINSENGSRSYVRRAFLGVQGRFSDHWRYKVDFNLLPGDDGAGQVAFDDAYLEYAGDFFSVVIGENNVTSPLEDRTSSLDIPFIERSSFINAFGYGRAAGVAGLVTGANWMAAVGVSGDSLNNADSNFAASELFQVSGRFTWAPIFETSPDGTMLLHLGVSARNRDFGDDGATNISPGTTASDTYRYRTRPLNGRGTRWIDFGTAVPPENDISYGAEIAGQWNAFGFTAEYAKLEGTESTQGAGTPADEYEFDGYYVDVTWSITGESRAYRGNQGSFGPIVPANPINEGGWGHWGLSARYDYVDLSDPAGGTSRGEQTAYALGLNWVPLDHVRFMLNYADTEADRTAAPSSVDADAQIITLRTQFDF
jgi:phosphate-selective porin OprO and OprP